MLTVKPRDQQKLVQDIKVVDRPNQTNSQNSNNTNKTQISENQKQTTPIKPQYRSDTQLAPTEIDSSKDYSLLPEEVGYITKFPASGHVQAWLYVLLAPVFAWQLYIRTSTNYKVENYSQEATKAVLSDYTSYMPAFGLVIILIIISCIYSRKTYMHYIGSFFAFVAFLIQGYILSVEINANILNLTNFNNSNLIQNIFSSSYLYSIMASIVLFLYSFLYFLLPKYRNTYQ